MAECVEDKLIDGGAFGGEGIGFSVEHKKALANVSYELAGVGVGESHVVGEFSCLAHIVEKDTCEDQVGLNVRVEGQDCDGDFQHIAGVFEQASEVVVVQSCSAGGGAELFHEVGVIQEAVDERL